MRYEQSQIRNMTDAERAALPQYVLCNWRKHDGSIDASRAQVVNLNDLKFGYMPPMDNEKAETLCAALNKGVPSGPQGAFCASCPQRVIIEVHHTVATWLPVTLSCGHTARVNWTARLGERTGCTECQKANEGT